jgi:hypothetical protein
MLATTPTCADYTGQVYLSEVRLNGAYDKYGVYWGVGEKLYNCYDAIGIDDRNFRASCRAEALEIAKEIYPKGKFRY